MTLLALAGAHSKIARRQKALWFTSIPLTAFATLLAVISPGRPGTGGTQDLAFSAQMIVMFAGVAYAAAFADFFTATSRLGMHELEASAPTAPLALRAARVLGTFGVVVVPALTVLLLMGIAQTINGHPWSLPAALAVTATIVAPGVLIAMSLSALLGAILPRALGRVAGVLVWFFLIFSSPMLPLPTINGTVLSVIGDAIGAGYFGTSPIYPPAGPLAFDGTPVAATVSLLAQLAIILTLLTAGSALAGRTGKH
jgi:ABC-2 type transport system permease protein